MTQNFISGYCNCKDTTYDRPNLAVSTEGTVLALCHFDNFKRGRCLDVKIKCLGRRQSRHNNKDKFWLYDGNNTLLINSLTMTIMYTKKRKREKIFTHNKYGDHRNDKK